MAEKMLLVSAHIGDFVWRCGGTIAKYVNNGAEVMVIVLTMGARGESNSYWKKPNATMEECKQIRMNEAKKATQALGVKNIVFMDYADFPLEMCSNRINTLAKQIVSFSPDIIVTHDLGRDRVNPDHHKTADAVLKAVYVAEEEMREAGTLKVSSIPIFGYEPMSPELCEYSPDILIDITLEFEQKIEAMNCLTTQKDSIDAYIQKAILRGGHCAGRGGKKDCKYAESFSMYKPVLKFNDFVW